MVLRTRTPSLSQNGSVLEPTERMVLHLMMERRMLQFVLESLAVNEPSSSKSFGGSNEWNADGIKDW
jgi:hypothetical protein